MLSADYKLIPVPTSDYIEKNEPQSYMKGAPIYAVGTYQHKGKEERKNYSRAYEQVTKLFDVFVKRRAQQTVVTRQCRENRCSNVREK